ncbi:MAG: inositol monophosphatase family protein [Nakamurella sp.]
MTNTDCNLEPDGLLDLAVRVARAAGAELMSRYGRIQGLSTKSSATDPVSDADRAAEALMVEMLSAERPDDGLLGEEGASRESQSGITWVIDPLDGTVNYLYELDNFSVSIAAEDPDGGLVGVVFDPVMDRIYTASRGGGAFAGQRRLRVNDPVPLDSAMLSTGFGYSAERRALQGAVIARVLPQIRDIRRFGSAALNLCQVAGGQVDAYYEEGVQHWDVAAGRLMAVEAGALMTTISLTGAETGWVVAGPSLHATLTAALAGSC